MGILNCRLDLEYQNSKAEHTMFILQVSHSVRRVKALNFAKIRI